ncbi:MAG: hypothetical protein WCG28_02440 [bacterium]
MIQTATCSSSTHQKGGGEEAVTSDDRGIQIVRGPLGTTRRQS